MHTIPEISARSFGFTYSTLSPTARRIVSQIADEFTPETARQYLAENHAKLAGLLDQARGAGADPKDLLRATFGPNLERCTDEAGLRVYALCALALLPA